MEPEGSLPRSQKPSTGPYPKPDEIQSIPLHPISIRSILTLSFHLRLGLTSGLFPSGFPTKTLCAFFSPRVLHVLPILEDQLHEYIFFISPRSQQTLTVSTGKILWR
jgi:hypothetical protein